MPEQDNAHRPEFMWYFHNGVYLYRIRGRKEIYTMDEYWQATRWQGDDKHQYPWMEEPGERLKMKYYSQLVRETISEEEFFDQEDIGESSARNHRGPRNATHGAYGENHLSPQGHARPSSNRSVSAPSIQQTQSSGYQSNAFTAATTHHVPNSGTGETIEYRMRKLGDVAYYAADRSETLWKQWPGQNSTDAPESLLTDFGPDGHEYIRDSLTSPWKRADGR